MKKIIVILFTILLALWIGVNLIMGDGEDSLKSGAESVTEKATQVINDELANY